MGYSDLILASSPRHYFRMAATSGTTETNLGTGSNGTYSGTYSFNQASLDLSSSNPSVSFTSGELKVLDSNQPTAYTIEVLLKVTSLSGTQNIFNKGDGGWSHQIYLNSDGSIAHYTYAAGFYTITSTRKVSVGSVVHIVATATNNVGIKLYINGVQDGSRSLGVLWNSGNDYSIGRAAGSGSVLNGIVDEVAFYETELSAATIQAHYLAARSLLGKVHEYVFTDYTDTYGSTSFIPNGGSLSGGEYIFPVGTGGYIPNAINRFEDYYIDIWFTATSLSGSYQRVLSFNNRTSDQGLYLLGNKIILYSYGTYGTFVFTNGVEYKLTLKRSSGIFYAYVNDVLDYTQTDSNNYGLFNHENTWFFKDDGGEDFAGKINKIIIANDSTGYSLINASFTKVVTPGTRDVVFTDTSTGATSWLWDFGDATSSTSQNPSHTYASNNTYTVTLTINGGATSTNQTFPVSIISAAFTWLQTDDKEITFDSSTSIGDGLTYSWTFGDAGTSTLANPSHTYANYTTYTATLTITDTYTSQSSIPHTVSVLYFSVDFTGAVLGKQLTFTNNSIATNSYLWDFDDGETSTDENPVHTYLSNNKYMVTLTGYLGLTSRSITKSVLIADSPDIFTPIYNEKRTFESDDNRIAYRPSVIRDANNRIILFYHKQVVSGKLSDTRITNPSGYSINVGSGNGTLNGISKAWSSASITAVPNVFQLVYVDLAPTTSVVGITSDFPMTFTKGVIPLAYVFSGSTAITRLIEVEKTGNYIYARRQRPDGSGGWYWDDYEELLNSGEQPYATINGNRIYITYTKDSSVYQRIIEVGNESNAWDLLLDYQINSSVISPSEIPFKVEQQMVSSGSMNTQSTPITFEQVFERPTDRKSLEASSNNFVLSDTFITMVPNGPGLGWYKSDTSSTYKFLIFLPYVSFKEVTKFVDGYYEIYDNNHVLQFDIPYSSINTYYELSTVTGPFYLGFRCSLVSSNLKKAPFVLPPEQRLYFLRDLTIFDLYETNATNNYGTVHLSTKMNSSGSICIQDTPITFEQVYSNNLETATMQASGSIAVQSVL